MRSLRVLFSAKQLANVKSDPNVLGVTNDGTFATADIDGSNDRRNNVDIWILDSGIDPCHPDLMVAGGAALLKANNPNMTPAQVRAKIIATGEPGPIPGDPARFPEGVLDVSTF